MRRRLLAPAPAPSTGAVVVVFALAARVACPVTDRSLVVPLVGP